MTQSSAAQQTKDAIRPFQVNVPEAELTDLRRRINATKWPEKETVPDASQGVQLATIQALARYWATDPARYRRAGLFRQAGAFGSFGR